MIFVRTASFRRDYQSLQKEIQVALEKALGLLLTDPRHHSLRSKKLPGTDFWYARITRGYRFTFQVEGQTITLRRVGTHDILSKERQ